MIDGPHVIRLPSPSGALLSFLWPRPGHRTGPIHPTIDLVEPVYGDWDAAPEWWRSAISVRIHYLRRFLGFTRIRLQHNRTVPGYYIEFTEGEADCP